MATGRRGARDLLGTFGLHWPLVGAGPAYSVAPLAGSVLLSGQPFSCDGPNPSLAPSPFFSLLCASFLYLIIAICFSEIFHPFERSCHGYCERVFGPRSQIRISHGFCVIRGGGLSLLADLIFNCLNVFVQLLEFPDRTCSHGLEDTRNPFRLFLVVSPVAVSKRCAERRSVDNKLARTTLRNPRGR